MATYDLQTLQTVVLSAAAVDALPSGMSTTQVVNRALDYLATCHGWHWRLTLANLNGAAAIDLPANFGELLSVAPQTGSKRMVRVPHHELLKLRQFSASLDTELSKCCFFALTGKTQASATAAALWKLECAPAAPNITVAYRRLPAALSGNTDLADIPAGFFDLLFQLCRCFATSMVKPSSPETAPEWVIADRMIDKLKEADARASETDQNLVEGIFEDYYNVGRFRPDWA